MVVWARSAPEKQKTVTTQTAQSQIPRFPQSHRLRIFAPWISVDHHWQNSGFFGFFLALAAGRLQVPPHKIKHRRISQKFCCRPPPNHQKTTKRGGVWLARNTPAKVIGVPPKSPRG